MVNDDQDGEGASAGNDDDRLRAVAMDLPPFAQHLAMRIVSFSPDHVEAEMPVTPQLGNRNGVLHGGAIMGYADNIGGTAAFLNLGEGQRTTTIESKTNFFRAIAVGDVASASCVPLHKGRSTMVWQTTIKRGDGKTAAIVTQTQMVFRAD